MRLLLVSNGYGEDYIGLQLAKTLRDLGYECVIAPLVGDGAQYRTSGFVPIMSQKMSPSGGFLRRFTDVLGDLRAGVWQQQWHNRKQLIDVGRSVHGIIAIGDVFCLSMAAKGAHCSCVFLPTAKSDTFMSHNAVEIQLIKRFANWVYTRDEETAQGLRQSKIEAQYLGNMMMDGVKFTGDTFGFDPEDYVLGVLPGSRSEAYGNIPYLLGVIEKIPSLSKIDGVLMAVAPQLEMSSIQSGLEDTPWVLRSSENRSDTSVLFHSHKGVEVVLSSQFYDVVSSSNLVIGLAGTANEQTVYLGRDLVCFPGLGPQSSLKRFREQSRLLGSDRHHLIEETDPEKIACDIEPLLAKTREKRRLGQIAPAAPSIAGDILAKLGDVG